MFERSAFEAGFLEIKLIGRSCFLCNTKESVRFALNARSDSFDRKAPQMRHTMAPVFGDASFINEGAAWRRRRDIVAPMLHISRLPTYAPHMVDCASEFAVRLEDHAGRPVDMRDGMAELAAEVVCRAVFGRELGTEYAREVLEAFSDYQVAADQIDLLWFFGVPEWLPRPGRRGLRRAAARIHGVLAEVIERCRASRSGEPAAIFELLDARDPETGEPLSEDAIRNEASVLFLAGHETTASTMAWAWYLLSQDPDAEGAFHQELETVLAGRTPTLDDVGRLDYTRAVVSEALRLYPPFAILPRETLRDEEFEGTTIPTGSLVFVIPWLLHRKRRLWRKPDHFMPERFLGDQARKISKYQYIPFSLGPRVCPGAAFANAEAVLCLATLGQRFRFRLAEGCHVEPVCRLTLRPSGPLSMTVEARNGAPHAGRPAPGGSRSVSDGCPVHGPI